MSSPDEGATATSRDHTNIDAARAEQVANKADSESTSEALAPDDAATTAGRWEVASGVTTTALAALVERVLNDGIARVVQTIEDRQALDRFREAQIDKLHAELQGYKVDVVARAVRPVLQSLIRLHDDLGKMLEVLSREEPEKLTSKRLLDLLKTFREDVEMALEQNGVTAFQADTELLDPRRQRVVGTLETAEPADVGRLAARVRPGFEQGDVILEKERVAVYALQQSSAQSGRG